MALPLDIRRYRPADRPSLLSFLERTFSGMGRRFVPDGKDADVGDLERLYLAPEYWGLGMGGALCDRAIEDARALGYRFLRLDTSAELDAALALFRKRGFREIPRYDPATPCYPGELFLEKAL